MFFSSILISAGAATATVPPVLCNGVAVGNLNPATMVHVRLDDPQSGSPPGAAGGLAVVSYQPASALTAMGNGGAPFGYSRITIGFTACRDAGQRTLVPEQRNPVYRYFVGKQADKVLQLKATVKPLGVSSSITLSSIHRKSGKGGEEWTTEVENNGVLLPYFRIDSNTLVRLEADFQSTREYNSTITADVLDIIKRASALISPAAPLITTQNRERFNDASNFVDNSVNGLLKVSIKEKPGLTISMDGLRGERRLAVVTLVVPRANDAFPSDQWPLVAIGQWTISAEPLRVSMLARYADDNVVPGSFTASSVMNFSVAEQKTLREALAGSSSVTAARDALIAAPDEARDFGRTFCRTVASEADSLGLAPVDAGIATWAALTDLALTDTKMASALSGCNGIEHFGRIAAAARVAADSGQ